jgi:succinate dehydrogenase / fumarate reductase flavoprotein subunit
METTVSQLFVVGGRVVGALAYRRSDGSLLVLRAKAVLLATGGGGRIYRVTSNSWECTGDGTALAYEAGAELRDCEMVQFHPTGMVWPSGVRGILVTEGVRGEGGILRNKDGERFMERYDPERMELSSRDVVARAINAEVLAGRGSPHGGAFLDISHKPAEFIKRKLPSMYDQFLKLAKVDITKEPMEVAPTIHYQMGGVRVDATTGATRVEGLFAAGEVAAGLHGANRLGGNSLSDLLVFGKRAGDAAAAYASAPRRAAAKLDGKVVAGAIDVLLGPLERREGDSPYKLQGELQDICTKYAPIIRDEEGLQAGLAAVMELKERADRCGTGGPTGRPFNPGWHTAHDLRNMVMNAEALFRSALERKESRGAHARSDYPKLDPAYERVNLMVSKGPTGEMVVNQVENEPIPYGLTEVITQSFQKYTPEETE